MRRNDLKEEKQEETSRGIMVWSVEDELLSLERATGPAVPLGGAQFQLIQGGRGRVLGQNEVIGTLLFMDQEFNGCGRRFCGSEV